MNLTYQRILGNWMTSFLSPLAGTSISFNLPIDDLNLKILLTAAISSVIVTGLVVARTLEHGNQRT